MAFITVLLLATAVVASDAHGDTAGSDALRLVEVALDDISSQISVLKTREDSIQQDIGQQIANIENQQRSLQNQVTAISSQLTSMQKTLDGISDCIANDTDPLPHSCEDILASSPGSPSDYYTIADSNGHTRQVYCHMDKDICDSQGGWTRIAMIDMTDTEQTCPYSLGLYNVSGVRACGRPSYTPGGCLSITFQSNQVTYSRVCGKVLGYQYGFTYGARDNWDINSAYIDGISLTLGYPRYHIWSYISGYMENHDSACPCGSRAVSAPSFVGSDYYCESGNPTKNIQHILYTGDILWDGSGCGSKEQSCCTRAGMPWFYKPLPYTTSDPIELRICCYRDASTGDIPFSLVELYIK